MLPKIQNFDQKLKAQTIWQTKKIYPNFWSKKKIFFVNFVKKCRSKIKKKFSLKKIFCVRDC